MFKNIFTNSFGILLSRITGFIRDLLQASILGANIYTDMFFVAFKMPNLFRRIFGEGAFTQSFIPTFAKSTHKSIFAYVILKKFSLALVGLTIFMYIFSKYFTKLIAWGFSDEVIAQTAPLVVINFHYLIFIFGVTFLSSLLQYKGHFATTALSTVLLNLSIISALLLSKGLPSKQIVYYLSFAVVLGGALQLFVHLIAIKKFKLDRLLIVGYKRVKKAQNPIKNDIDRFKKGFLASLLGGSTAQISAFIDGILASFLVTGSISYLYYANRLFQFPLAIFATATGVAIFPRVAKYLNQDKQIEAKLMLKKSFWLLLYILSFATIVGIVFSKYLIWLLLQRGAFTQADTIVTSNILIMYLVGLIPFGLAKIFSLWLYSQHKQAVAAKISAIALIADVILAIILVNLIKVEGLALAGSLGGVILFVLTIKEFGVKNFLDILSFKHIMIYILFVAIMIVSTISLKGYLSAYIQL